VDDNITGKSLLPSSQSSSLLLSLLPLPHSYPSCSLPFPLLPLSHPHYLSPSFLSVILTTSPSFIPLNPPPHYLSSLSCNIIIHLITSVFLPSSFSFRGDLKEEDRKDEVTKVNEEERSSEEEVIRMMMMRTEEKSIRKR
jgi:hypothetical protein